MKSGEFAYFGLPNSFFFKKKYIEFSRYIPWLSTMEVYSGGSVLRIARCLITIDTFPMFFKDNKSFIGAL